VYDVVVCDEVSRTGNGSFTGLTRVQELSLISPGCCDTVRQTD